MDISPYYYMCKDTTCYTYADFVRLHSYDAMYVDGYSKNLKKIQIEGYIPRIFHRSLLELKLGKPVTMLGKSKLIFLINRTDSYRTPFKMEHFYQYYQCFKLKDEEETRCELYDTYVLANIGQYYFQTHDI